MLLFWHCLFYFTAVFFAITFDENFSKASGIPVGRFNALLSVLTAVTITLGMRMMGAMLISSLIIFPALIAMRLQRSFSGVIIAAAITAVIDFLLGLVISFLLSTPTGASIVLVNLCVLLIVTAIQKIRGK